MPEYNEEVSSHLPSIHEDSYTWDQFINLLKGINGETYEPDKIYFIEDVDSSAVFLRNLTQELLTVKEEIQTLLNSLNEGE